MGATRIERQFRAVSLAISTTCLVLGSTNQARTQAADVNVLNLQSILDTHTLSLTEQLKPGTDVGGDVCQVSAHDAWLVYNANGGGLDEKSYTDDFNTKSAPQKTASFIKELQLYLLRYYSAGKPPKIDHEDHQAKVAAAFADLGKALTITPNAPDPCKIPQWTKVKISLPFNPTYETNVLRTNQGSGPGTTSGFNGSLLVTASAGLENRPYDLIAFSAQSTSIRYPAFATKNVDSATTQGAYQFLLGANGYHVDDLGRIDGHRSIESDLSHNSALQTPDEKVRYILKTMTTSPQANLTTFDTLAFGFQNQTAFTPTFHHETADLFTPQATLARSNMSLFGADDRNVCPTTARDSITHGPDYRKAGFCYYADFALTVGQTFSDQVIQQNANLAASATLGWRIRDTDFKLSLQTTATEKNFEYVPGGRRDLMLQSGPALSYAPPPISNPFGSSAVTFSLATTYNQNYSTLSAAAWRGIIVQPTLTIAFQPPASLPADHY